MDIADELKSVRTFLQCKKLVFGVDLIIVVTGLQSNQMTAVVTRLQCDSSDQEF